MLQKKKIKLQSNNLSYVKIHSLYVYVSHTYACVLLNMLILGNLGYMQ